MDHTSVRALPIPVRPVDGETPGSYLARLSAANHLPIETLWSQLRHFHPGLPARRTPELAAGELEQLGGISFGWFAESRARHQLPVRCSHTGWALQTCWHCSRPPSEQSGCLRCAHGQATRVRTRNGPVCLRHARWHIQGVDVDVAGLPAYLVAERRIRSRLSARGVALSTGELQLGTRLLASWTDPQRLSAVETRVAALGARGAPQALADHPGFLLFPEAVRLTEVLTDPAFISYLLSPHWASHHQAELLAAAIAGVTGEAPPLVPAVLDEVLENGASAVRAAYAMVGTRRTSRRCSMQKHSPPLRTRTACACCGTSTRRECRTSLDRPAA